MFLVRTLAPIDHTSLHIIRVHNLTHMPYIFTDWQMVKLQIVTCSLMGKRT